MIRRIVLAGLLAAGLVAPTPAPAWLIQGTREPIPFTAWHSCARGFRLVSGIAGTAEACDLALNTATGTFVEISACTLSLKANGLPDWDVALSCAGGTQTVNQWAIDSLDPAVFTGTGSSSGTVLTITAVSANTVRLGMDFSSGIYVTSFGTGTGGTGTYNLNTAWNVGSGARTGNPSRLRLKKAYDQVAGNACNGASCDLVQTDTAFQFAVCSPGNSQVVCSGVGDGGLAQLTGFSKLAKSANIYAASSPLSMSAVVLRVSGNVMFIKAGGFGSSSTLSNGLVSAGANLLGMNGQTGGMSVAATDGVLHSMNGRLIDNPETSRLNIDGTESTSIAIVVDTNTSDAGPRISGRNDDSSFGIMEDGWYAGAWSDAQIRRLCANQAAFYGTTVGANCS